MMLTQAGHGPAPQGLPRLSTAQGAMHAQGVAAMADTTNSTHPTLALSTKQEFVSPLTAMRGALEILRDFPDLAADQRARFVETALSECARLEKGVEHLASTVYAAGQRGSGYDLPASDPVYARRIHVLDELETIEVDLSDFEFSSSKRVNDFYDVLDRLVEGTGRSWYFVVNYRDCSIWPEAWVAFAHRGKKVNVNYSLGTVRYVERGEDERGGGARAAPCPVDPDMLPSRELALARIAELRREASTRPRRGSGGR